MGQVYAIVHDGKRMLIAKKNLKGYFFVSEEDKTKSVLTEDGKEGISLEQNGGGKNCFPGGGLEGGNVKAGAINEFKEETGVDLGSYEYKYKEIKKPSNFGFFEVSQEVLDEIFDQAKENISKANGIAKEIAKGNITENKALNIQRGKDFLLTCNELEYCKIVDINQYTDYFKMNDDHTSWFYEAVKENLN